MYSEQGFDAVDRRRVLRSVPAVDRCVVLHARIAADIGGVGNLPHQVARPVGFHDRAVHDRMRLPLAIAEHGLHELVGHANAVIRILEEDRRIRFAIHAAAVPVVQQHPRLLLFVRLGVDELDDVGMADIEDHHLRRAPRLAARLDDAGKRIEPLHERHRAGRDAAARKRFLRGPDRRQIASRSRTPLEEHAFGLRQIQNRAHRVLDRIDEAGGALRLCFHAAVEPDRRVERHHLIHQQMRQLIVKDLRALMRREISALNAPSVIVRATRPISCRTLVSRSGVPRFP